MRTQSTPRVQAYEVNVRGRDWGQIEHAISPGKAKAIYFQQVRDAWEYVKFTDLTCRVIGDPVTSPRFALCAEYRGFKGLKVGTRCDVGGELGTIVGHNDSANFAVLFDATSKHQGHTLNVHPDSLKLLA